MTEFQTKQSNGGLNMRNKITEIMSFYGIVFRASMPCVGGLIILSLMAACWFLFSTGWAIVSAFVLLLSYPLISVYFLYIDEYREEQSKQKSSS